MIKIIAVGKVKEKWIKEGIDMFLERLKRFYRVEVVEVGEDKIMGRIREGDYIIVCDETGEEMGSEDFSGLLKKKIEDDVVFLIGGAEGLKKDVKDKGDKVLCISKMTFTHEMARLFLVEQIYRAFTMMKGVRYHK